MIDNPGTVARLVVQLENQLPIPAFPTKEVVRTLRRRGLQASTDRALSVKRVFYAGDEAGFVCDVTPSRTATEVLIVSRQSHNFADVCHSELLRLTQRVADILRLEDALSLETDAELKRGTILIHGRFTRTARVRSDRCAAARATTGQAFGRDFHGARRDSIDRRIASAARRTADPLPRTGRDGDPTCARPGGRGHVTAATGASGGPVPEPALGNRPRGIDPHRAGRRNHRDGAGR